MGGEMHMEYNNETKICQNCQKEFIIDKEDFSFYEKIKVPPPTWCPECRLIRRLAYRESRPLYKDTCGKCGKEIVSIYNTSSKIIAYCTSCFWSDTWDAVDYGSDYDFSRPFFQQFYDLQKITPREATGSKNNTNCVYSNGDVRCKDCILTFDCFESINCYNSQVLLLSRDSIDSDSVVNGDHVYENFGCNGVYTTKFAYFSDECLNSSFIFNCIGCTDCFGCVNLRNKKYCIWNKQLSKDEYKKTIQEFSLGSYRSIINAKEKFLNLYNETPRRFALIKNSVDVTGNDIKNTKNCKNCFFTRQGVENSKYIFACGLLLKDSYDATFGGERSELFYETSGGMQSQKCLFCRAPNSCKNLEYCDRLTNCSDCFGCAMLRNKQYCILNKQYTKNEYFSLREKIIENMNKIPFIDQIGRVYKYGEFFPSELSMWAYNESWAHKYFRLTEEEAIRSGYNWQGKVVKEHTFDIKAEDLPDNLNDVSDNILNKVIECEHYDKNCNEQCTGVFRILPNEFNFYKQMDLALPRLCPMCRHYERLKYMNHIKLWHRKCMNNGCQNEFDTVYSPDDKFIVYCEECYKREFI